MEDALSCRDIVQNLLKIKYVGNILVKHKLQKKNTTILNNLIFQLHIFFCLKILALIKENLLRAVQFLIWKTPWSAGHFLRESENCQSQLLLAWDVPKGA